MSIKNTKVVTGLVRFAYVNVHRPVMVYDGEQRYGVTIIIPKDDVNTLDEIILAVEAAMEKGQRKLEGVSKGKLKMPVRDGDEDRAKDEAYAGCYFINAYSKEKPRVVDRNIEDIKEEGEFYSGCYGRASISFYVYNHGENVGVACGLLSLQKLKDGEVLGSYSDPKLDFGSISEDYLW